MTMNEPRDSPARRQQFLVVCTIMAGMFAHGMMTAGAFSSLSIKEGVFPGGTFVYKSASRCVTGVKRETDTTENHTDAHTATTRDYAAAASLIERIASDVHVHPKREAGDLLYSLFLDDPTTMMNGHNLRFACGLLVDNEGQDKKQTLLAMNDEIRKLQMSEETDLSLLQMWERSTYETTSLPSVDSAVVQFPFTDGIASALVLNYKVSLCVDTHKTLVFCVMYELTPDVSA